MGHLYGELITEYLSDYLCFIALSVEVFCNSSDTLNGYSRTYWDIDRWDHKNKFDP